MNYLEVGNPKNWPENIVIFTDGASRGNPGPASIGVVIYDHESENPIYEYAERLGENTNNFAEYQAVIRGLSMAVKNKTKKVLIKTDSQLLVRQLLGEYKVKSETLRPLYLKCMELKSQLPNVSFEHIRRELNKKADQLANLALDSLT